MGETTCVVCKTRVPDRGLVCEVDRERLTAQLCGLPKQIGRLAAQLAPATAAAADSGRVRVARPAAPTAARLDVLNLLGPGSDALAAAGMTGLLNPYVRRWRTVEKVRAGDGRELEIETWHQELVDLPGVVKYSNSRAVFKHVDRPWDNKIDGQPRPILHDDQAGLVPPAAWAASWTRYWRQKLGHHSTRVRPVTAVVDTAVRAFQGAIAEGVLQHQEQMTDLLGLRGWVPHGQRPTDPHHEQWRARFGPAERGFVLGHDINYLLAWLGAACDRDLDMARFTCELRALSAELIRVLGDNPDQQWLGRCPAMLTNQETYITRPCGAGLWQDPFASQVECCRCHTTWGPARADLLQLAWQIRKIWPLDRRRRYITAECAALASGERMVRCPSCSTKVNVVWRDATARGDRNRFWTLHQVNCPHGCAEAGRLI